MTRFETPIFDLATVAATYDDLPLWAAPFGLALLDAVRLRPGLAIADIGCGTGFPLVELAERAGRDAHAHGIDPWRAALERARLKLDARAVANVTLHEAVAEAIPLPDRSVDLIVSNNGLNNVADLDRALAECARIARPGAQLVFTFNLPASMQSFYDILSRVLARRGDADASARIAEHVHLRRKPMVEITAALARASFRVTAVREARFALSFASPAAMFDHSFVRLAFLGSWLALAPNDTAGVFAEVEAELGAGPIALDVPFACVDAIFEGDG